MAHGAQSEPDRKINTGQSPDFLQESNKVVDEVVSGKAESVGGMLLDATSRLQDMNKAYREDLAFTQDAVRKLTQRVIEALKNRIGKTEHVIGDTRAAVALLHETIKVHGEAIKIRETPYADQYGKKADVDTLAPTELKAMRQFVEDLGKLDTDELLDMLDKNALIVDLLAEVRLGKKQEETPEETGGELSLDRNGEYYDETLKTMVDFILGKDIYDEGKKKSPQRKMTEALLWQEIVRGLDKDQLGDLVEVMLQKATPEETQKFITTITVVGASNYRDLKMIYEEGMQSWPELYNKLGSHFIADVREAVKVRAIIEKKVEKDIEVRSIQRPQNAAAHFFTFNILAAETVTRLGAITAVVNGILKVTDSINKRAKKEGWFSAISKGVAEAAVDPYVLGGAAVAAAASNVIHPWAKNWAYAPGGAEKEMLYKTEGEKFLRRHAEDHPEILDYFAEHYEGFRVKAEKNEREGKKLSKGGETLRYFDLYPDDIEMTLEEANAAGYGSPDEAKSTIIQMFAIFARSAKLKGGGKILNETQVQNYYRQQGLLGEIVSDNSEGA